MLGGMQDWELRVPRLIDHAAREHGRREIVSHFADGTEIRTNWAATGARLPGAAGVYVRAREEIADIVVKADVGRWIRAAIATNGGLIDVYDAMDMLRAFYGSMVAR